MAFVDYYKILGVDKNIPQKDVRAAYRKRAKQFHPDLHPNDPKAKAKFQALNEAYEVISDPDKRQIRSVWRKLEERRWLWWWRLRWWSRWCWRSRRKSFRGLRLQQFRKWRRRILQLLRKSLRRRPCPWRSARRWFRRLWWLRRFRRRSQRRLWCWC